MIAAILALFMPARIELDRDAYGVPIIRAVNRHEAFRMAGYAVAQDRLWQLENSRRVSRGRMAEVFGRQFVASDREIAQYFYSDAELQKQLDGLDAATRDAFAAYAEGVNAYIDEATKQNSLPAGYASNGFAPDPWSPIDSAAIAVRLLQQFGRGGAGEIRNMALLGYLKTQPKLKGHELDVLNDFAWFQDPQSTCTITPKDESKEPHPTFNIPTSSETASHVSNLPKLSLFELLPGVRLAERQESTRVAELVSAPFKVGSYCVVVGPKRSATGSPLLLSAPQMGWQTPSIVHEMSISSPEYSAVGMDVPGIPGILIGHTKDMAWGLTSGVADVEDVFFYPSPDERHYQFGSVTKEFEMVARTIKVKGEADVTVTQQRTVDGPVVLASRSAKVAFSRKGSFWMRELQSLDTTLGMANAKTSADVESHLRAATVSFNFFYALSNGDFGYRYIGRMPIRKPGFDPRFPMPGGPENGWRGEIPFEQMPHVVNPSAGFLANWNNKPVSWWTNGDTPVWGRAFRNTSILNSIPNRPLVIQDLENVAWTIARMDENYAFTAPLFAEAQRRNVSKLGLGFDGRLLEGSIQAALFSRFNQKLKEELFLPVTGNFASPDNFRQVTQATVVLNALAGKTSFNYLAGRSRESVLNAAFSKALSEVDIVPPLRYTAGAIPVPDQPAIPYSNRGTYIQLIEFLQKGIFGRNVVSPGVAESGAHSRDQVPLARAWTFKPMILPRN